MGKTYRNEKSFKPKSLKNSNKRSKPLHNHRDLPDFYEPDPYDREEEEYHAKEIRSQEEPSKPE